MFKVRVKVSKFEKITFPVFAYRDMTSGKTGQNPAKYGMDNKPENWDQLKTIRLESRDEYDTLIEWLMRSGFELAKCSQCLDENCSMGTWFKWENPDPKKPIDPAVIIHTRLEVKRMNRWKKK